MTITVIKLVVKFYAVAKISHIYCGVFEYGTPCTFNICDFIVYDNTITMTRDDDVERDDNFYDNDDDDDDDADDNIGDDDDVNNDVFSFYL